VLGLLVEELPEETVDNAVQDVKDSLDRSAPSGLLNYLRQDDSYDALVGYLTEATLAGHNVLPGRALMTLGLWDRVVLWLAEQPSGPPLVWRDRDALAAVAKRSRLQKIA